MDAYFTFRLLLVIILQIGYINLVQSNCNCNDCPWAIPLVGSGSSTLTVSGAASNVLGANGQRLRAIHLDFFHDAIAEIELILQAPNGSQIILIQQNMQAQLDRNNHFSICFVDCGEGVNPHPGTSSHFNTLDFDVIGENYSGTYYPSNPNTCLSDLTGSVNGTWTLIWDDFLVLMGGTLFSWSLEFENNTGTGCQSICELPSCVANGGNIGPISEEFCAGSAALNLDIPINFGGNPPNNAIYGYQFIMTDDAGIVLEYASPADLTGYEAGSYNICGISYLLSQFAQLPSPDGTITLTDIQNTIDQEGLCAELSDNCISIIIEPLPEAPDISGPQEVCLNESVVYTVNNFDPETQLIVNLSPHSVSEFSIEENQLFVTFLSGPIEACFSIQNDCGSSEPTCLTINILGPDEEISIDGPLEVCPNIQYTYEISPSLSPGSSFSVTVEGGTLITQTNNQFVVTWFDDGGIFPKTASVTLIDDECGEQPPVTIEVVLIEIIPPIIFGDLQVCQGSSGVVMVDDNPDATNYIWTGGAGITILSGQGSSGPVVFSTDLSGFTEICVEMEGVCGLLDPVCEFIEVLDFPTPFLDEVDPTCSLDFILSAHTEPTSSGFWNQLSGPSPATIFNPNSVQTAVQVFNSGIYSFEFTENNGLCEGTSVIFVEILNPPNVVEESIICLGGEGQVRLLITGGVEPYTIDGIEIFGNVFVSSSLADNSSYEFSIIDAIGCMTVFNGLVSCPCMKDAGTMSGEPLEICISTEESAEANFNNDATLDINDVGVYILHDSPSNVLGNIIDINTTGIFEFQVGITPGVVYYISFVVGESLDGELDVNDPCLSVALGQPVIFYSDPDIQLMIENAPCGFTTELFVSSVDPITAVVWTLIDSPEGSSAEFDNPTDNPTIVQVDQSGNYMIQLEISNQACSITEEFNIDFLGQPEIDNIEIECLSSEFIIATISFLDDSADFSVNLPGEFVDQLFISELLEANSTYAFEIVDINGCTTQATIGPIDCDCISTPGSMGSDTLFFCETGGVVVLDFLNNGQLGQLDTSLFVIHRLSGSELGDPVYITDQTTFDLPAGLETGVLYYISNIVTEIDPSGEPDLSSSCLRVSFGQPLFIYPLPIVDLPADSSVCFGPLSLDFANTNTGAWSLIAGSSPADFVYQEIDETLLVTPEVAGNVILEYTAINGLCELSDTLNLIFWDLPFFSSVSTECTEDYFITTLEISDGIAPYMVNGIPLSSNEFTADAAPSDSVLIFTVIDSRGCSMEISVTQNCDCETSSGTLASDAITLCEGQDIDLSIITLSDSIVPEGYELIYVLINGPLLMSDNIIQQSEGSFISWSPQIELNRTYYLVAIVTTLDGSSANLDDICISVSNAIPVVWEPIPRVLLDGSVEGCLGDEVNIVVESNGNFPFEITLRNSLGAELTIVIENNVQQVTYTPEAAGLVTWEVIDVTSDCSPVFTGIFSVDIVEPVDIDLSNNLEVCNNSLFGSQINLAELIDGLQEGIWLLNGVEIMDGIFDFDGFDAGTYELEFSTVGFEFPCPGNIFIQSIEVLECLCPTIALPNTFDLCSSDTSLVLDDIFSVAFEGEWTLDIVSGMGLPPDLSNGIITLGSTTHGEYIISYILSGDFPDDCQLEWEIILHAEKQPQSGIPIQEILFCSQEDELVTLNNYLIDADEGGIWFSESGEVIDPLFSSNQLGPGHHIFTYRVSGGICPSSVSEIEILVPEALDFSIISIPPLCPGINDGSIEIIIETGHTDVDFYLNNNLQSSFQARNLGPGIYIVQLRDQFECTYSNGPIEFGAAQEYVVDLGEDRLVNFGEEISLMASTNIPGQEISSVRWFNAGDFFEDGALEIGLSLSISTIISIEIITQDGCIITDDIFIRVTPPSTYLPNTFYPNSTNHSNQTFGPFSMDDMSITIESFEIFDRWGNRVYEIYNVEDAQRDVYWDGTFKGRNAMEGVYVYKLIFSNLVQKSVLLYGEVLLLR